MKMEIGMQRMAWLVVYVYVVLGSCVVYRVWSGVWGWRRWVERRVMWVRR